MKKEFKSEKNAYRFAATTTQEELAGRVSACGGMVCKFNDLVLVVNYCWCGFVAGLQIHRDPGRNRSERVRVPPGSLRKIGGHFRGWRPCDGMGFEPGSLNPCGKEILYENISD